MRRTLLTLSVLGLLVGLTQTSRTADDDTAALIDKAIKAHFPKGLDTKNKAVRMKTKGTLHIGGMDLPFTQEVAIQLPNKLKEVMELTVNNNNITITSIFDGKDAWIRAGDKDVKVTDDIRNEFKDALYAIELLQGTMLKDKNVKISLVGDAKVKDKPAVGVKVSREGHKDINLFIDKESGLICKIESRKLDFQSGQEVTEERIITEYQEKAGRKVAKKVEVLRDGKEYLEAEVSEYDVSEKLDDGEFAKPK
jgi:hypothetical protein